MGQETFWTQRDAATEYTRLARVCESLFAALGTLAPRLEPPSASLAAAQLARRLGRHATEWAELVPESVLLEDARAAAPPSAAIDPTIATVVAALDDLRDAVAALITRTSDIGDAAAQRAARATLVDLDAALDSLRAAGSPTAG